MKDKKDKIIEILLSENDGVEDLACRIDNLTNTEMTLSQLRDRVITGSFVIGESGIKEPVSGLGKSNWEFYANRLEDMILLGML